MLEESENLSGLDVYTPEGIFAGKVSEVVFDVSNRRIDSLIVNMPSPVVAEEGVILGIPYGWVSAVGDIVILNTFPGRIMRDGTVNKL